ncbi:MAG: GNAT family N-acetyltransferase [bacterium]|nr:GNAT family N-acetyltransferase [bacterium]
MAQLRIRALQGSDLTAVLRIWNSALTRSPIDEVRFIQIIVGDPDYWPGDDSGFLVATMRDEPVGFCRAIIRRWPNDRLGIEPNDGWIPLLAVDPDHQRRGVGTALLQAGLVYFRRHGRRRIWICGTPTSAPGSIVPGVDLDAQAGALALFQELGFVVDQQGYSMAREIIDFDVCCFRAAAWEKEPDVRIVSLTPELVQDFLIFLADALPGAWCVAARAKIRTGRLHEMLVAVRDGQSIGYCQWTGEHFGPFGVAPDARNRRVGAKLFTEAATRMREADGRTVWFNWADENARRFYERFGLRVTRRFAVLRKDV